MAYAARSVSFVSDETAGRNNFANRVKGSDQALLAAVIFPAAGADDLQHFEDKGALGREAHLVAKDRGINLVDITLSVPVEETAAAICDNWQKKNQEIYKYLITELF